MAAPPPQPDPGTADYQSLVDHELMTTRGARHRLDFDRDVDDQTILDCIDGAEQAPSGGNNGSRRWMIIRDQATKDKMAETDKESRIVAGRQREHKANMQRVIEGIKVKAEVDYRPQEPASGFPNLGSPSS